MTCYLVSPATSMLGVTPRTHLSSTVKRARLDQGLAKALTNIEAKLDPSTGPSLIVIKKEEIQECGEERLANERRERLRLEEQREARK